MIARLRARRRRLRAEPEIDVTAFMNLMVVLVPFLLLSAVFSHLAVMELHLPESEQARPADPPRLRLELTVRRTGLLLADAATGPIARFPRRDEGYDYGALAAKLAEIKARFPEAREITLLLEPEIAYQTLVDVMDTVRLGPEGGGGLLFPDVALGEAPPEGAP
ncbi:ExbD/TolR family protein [Inmirania thermothiophila]|uniref:Biopolymer transport protein ExbD n=1 Tax=Inmirania thermothiophila TaxID=1750597 RepID=A0A3N1XS68_9GAMM|nr:biopolymer transporter ExbD [Inmirania thermothiophila]ROR29499.1 biopolymer transport protein ExbD [Inmirania thermothiophila]